MSEDRRGSDSRPFRRREIKAVTVAGWLGTLTLSAIPAVNVVFWFVWAFGAKKPSRKSFARAALILSLIGVIGFALAIGFYGQEILDFARRMNPDLFLTDRP